MKKLLNVFVEFHTADIDLIRKIPGFIDAWEYFNRDTIVHRREFGMIETDEFNVIFLGNNSKINDMKKDESPKENQDSEAARHSQRGSDKESHQGQ